MATPFLWRRPQISLRTKEYSKNISFDKEFLLKVAANFLEDSFGAFMEKVLPFTIVALTLTSKPQHLRANSREMSLVTAIKANNHNMTSQKLANQGLRHWICAVLWLLVII